VCVCVCVCVCVRACVCVCFSVGDEFLPLYVGRVTANVGGARF